MSIFSVSESTLQLSSTDEMASSVNQPHVMTDVTANKKTKRLDLVKRYFHQKFLIPRDEQNDDVSTINK